ncbi:MAG: XRE family transcriptional regulator [Desulfomonilaceae bacterium]|jgi:transcriptional regulator with XRE-family HTH domain
MNDEFKETSYQSFRDTVDGYGEGKGSDLLTDPAAVEAARQESLIEKNIDHAAKLRAARESLGFSINELAGRVGVSPEILEEVEAGKSILPLGQLIKLSKALSLKMSDVISEGDKPFIIVRAGDRKSFKRFGKSMEEHRGYEYESLASGKKNRLMEPFIVTLNPSDANEPSAHDGQEFIYVLEGEMDVLVGPTEDVLGPGDAIYYDSSDIHLVKAHGDKPARILAVLIS